MASEKDPKDEDTKTNVEDTEGGEKTVVSSDTFKVKMSEARDVPPSIVLVMGPIEQMGKQWTLIKSDMIIGRSPQCDIFVDDKSVSKTHAQIIITPTQVSVVDLDSTNGTELGGKKIVANQAHPLRNNDHIKVGNVLFKYLEKGNIETISHQKTYDRSQLDPLTEINNKGAFLVKSEEVFKKAKLTETPLSLVVFDLDNFKSVNDTYGHAAGDYVLKELASVVQNTLIRQNDFFARFGGEEFVLLMAGCPLKRGIEIAERIRSTIEKHFFSWEGTRLNITISVGVATLEADMHSPQDLFEKADQASYVSKKAGKNRVSTI